METTQKTETHCTMSKPRKEGGGERGAGSRAAPTGLAELPLPRVLRAHIPSARCPCQFQKDACAPGISPDTTKNHHPSPLRRERGAGRGNCGDHGMTDRAPQEGQWLGQLSQKGGGRVYCSTDGGGVACG